MSRFALSMYVIFKLYYAGNQGSHDVKLQVTMAAKFNVSEVLSMCYKHCVQPLKRMNSAATTVGQVLCVGTEEVTALS